MQDYVKNPDILAAYSTDHSPLLFSLFLNKKEENRGKGLWKFNSSLTTNSDFVEKMKIFIIDMH